MKRKVFLKLSNKTKKMLATARPNNTPFDNGHYRPTYYPTITIALNIEIPDDIFDKAQAEIDLKIKEAIINSEIKIEKVEA